MVASSLLVLLRQLEALLERLVGEYERRLLRAPIVERDQTALTRDYNNALNKYQEIKDKQLEAQLAQQLELDEKAERFTMLSKARFPDSPESPNRLGILLLGIVLGTGCGLGTAAVAEYTDRTVRGARGVLTLMQTMPLASIPLLHTAEEVRAQSKRRWMIVCCAIGCLALGLLAVHLYLVPIDELGALLLESTHETGT